MQFRPAPMDNIAKIITSFVYIMWIMSIIAMIWVPAYFWAGLIMIIALSVSILIAYLLKPVQYELQGNNLIVHKPFNQKVSLPPITAATKTKATGIRTFGVGGLHGYFGRFNGDDIWFVTDRKKGVKLETKNKTYFISPDSPSEFIHNFELQNKSQTSSHE